ncbi:uncharacterized protein LOC100141760 isoform X8 [Tribolium castaneum]|uniref:uncharacterized protein LOC100141760 isoform X8 n=1 Tax=Tribolium castaneum TaxID=7070 RepID=UPI00046C335B|nr:PREDICTED: uncharacterized protein LOC100141760 isoform X9 [Tribolium castaneum]|eukprot:XP_008197116.1 PREDICTED: uncharacterized protein LOC100141760 isoform X9 [Tribolium castaneum]
MGSKHQLKIEQLLEKFLELKCGRRADASAKKLLNYFWQLETRDNSVSIKFPLFTKWIKKAISVWESKKVTPPPNIVTFTLNLANLLAKNEQRFCELNSNNFFIKLFNVLKVRESETGPKIEYIKLLSSFLEYKSGAELMIASTFWEEVLKMTTSADPDLVRESTNFLQIFLAKTIDLDENFCNEITKRLMAPLGENVYNVLKTADDGTTPKSLKPTLQLIGNILAHFLEGILFGRNDFRVLFLFLQNFHLEERIADFMIIAQSQSLVFDIAKIMFIMQFIELYLDVLTGNANPAKINATVAKIKKNFFVNMSKGPFEDVMDFCAFGYLYWRVFESKISFSLGKNLLSLADNSNGLLLIPHAYLLVNHCLTLKEAEEREESDDYRNTKTIDFFKRADKDFLRVGAFWRNYLISSPEITQYCLKSLECLKGLMKFLTKESALMIFGTFYYELKDIIQLVQEFSERLEFFEEEYFTKILELLRVVIEDFTITWREFYNVCNIIDVCFDLLLLTRWSSSVVVEVLKLINVAVKMCITPNMALLLDKTPDSALDLLGPLIAVKLQDETEVKVAALEVVLTMTRMSANKFPSLQKVLMDSELPTLVVKMSTCDSESFVRATAIKCLQEMIQVEEIWNNALKSEDLPQKMRDVLLNETEGIVRVEAATFMCVAYENQQFPKDTLDRVYETMIYASTTDLHWEVKVRALDFWDKVIKNHLQNQGMIDGSFPNVTFSKEHRKIVTLTDSEIRKRLLKVLSQLSSIGCLGVLMSAIKDDCDMEVSKTAAKITQRLVELFKKYNVRSDGSTPTSPLPTENGMSTASVSSGISVDESMDSPSNHHELNEDIIDQIVNSKDVCLLRNVYAPSEYSSVSNYDIQVRRVVTPNEFLQFTQQDLNTIISEKKNWLNGIEDLGSLLDDMLKTYEDDVNNMDCY